ncbi:MAG: inositol monophosphatase [Planctomycetota bacterium]
MRPSGLVPGVEAAFRAVRAPILEVFASPPVPVEHKDDGTVVTDLDRRLEERLAEALLALDPAFGLVGEEGGLRREGDPVWHLDPLDGTLNFTRRLPLFAVQTVLVEEGRVPLFAAIYDPLADVFGWAGRGEGAWWGGERLAVSRRGRDRALLVLDLARGGRFVTEEGFLARLRRAVYRARALGCVALDLAAVARAQAEGFVSTRRGRTPVHDFGPGLLFVREAGGLVTTFEGADPFDGCTSLLAAPPAIHADLLEVVGGA